MVNLKKVKCVYKNTTNTCKMQEIVVFLQCVFHGIRLLRLIKKLIVVRQSIFLCLLKHREREPKWAPFSCLFGINYLFVFS